MIRIIASLIVAFMAYPAYAEKRGAPVVVVSEASYTFESHTTPSKGELLSLLKAARVHQPVVINWVVHGGDDQARALVEARAAEVRKMLETAGIAVARAQVGNEVF